MITERQIRAARGLLGWDAADLAEKAKLTRATLSNIENNLVQARSGSLEKIVRVFSENGIEFLGDYGVELRNDRLVTLKGENIFFRVLDDVVATLRNAQKPEALFACVDDQVSPPVVIENYRRLRKTGIKMRSLVREGDTYLMGNLEEYRYLPEAFFHNSTTVIYGDKVATMILDPETKKDENAIIIRNPHVAAAQRNLFNLIWSVSKQPKVTKADIRYDE
ncbi:MAG: helix-turn-helix transcriptional regulator [Alphaproteobacteria bacterium]|nr:helix-turn-helix transcriptional regulator [Alphaproteobacteria bacterium]